MNVSVFVVWEPILPTDWTAPTSGVLGRLSDVRARQYWDEDHILAKRMAREARPPQPVQSCCDHEGLLWDLAAVYPKGALWTDTLPPASVFDGPVVDVAAKIESALSE